MLRFRKLAKKETLLKLSKAFILPHFYCCSSVWHCCGVRNTDKVDNLTEAYPQVYTTGPGYAKAGYRYLPDMSPFHSRSTSYVILCIHNVVYSL